MGTVTKRAAAGGVRYRAQVFKHGVRDGRTFESRIEAEDWIVTREAEILRLGGPLSRRTVAEAIEKYRDTAPRPRADVLRYGRLLRSSWARLEIGALTTAHLAAWRDARLLEVQPATVVREMTVLRTVLETARIEWGWIERNPLQDVRRPREPPARRRVITEAELAAMRAALGFDGTNVRTIGHETAVALLFALETAMRAGEIVGMRWADIDIERKQVRLPKTKNGERRDVPLSIAAIALLEVLRAKRMIRVRRAPAAGRVFHVDARSLDVTFRRARTAAGLAGFVFHDSRATAITRLAKKLQPLELARMTGHKNLNELLSYYAEPAESIAERLG